MDFDTGHVQTCGGKKDQASPSRAKFFFGGWEGGGVGEYCPEIERCMHSARRLRKNRRTGNIK